VSTIINSMAEIDLLEPSKYGSVLLFSGGLDSTVVAAYGALSAQPRLCVFVHQGVETHAQAASAVVEALGLDMLVVDMSQTYNILMRMANHLNPGQKFMPGYRLYTWMVGLSVAQMLEIPTLMTGEYGLSAFEGWNPEARGFTNYLAGASVNDGDPIAAVAQTEARTDARADFAAIFNQLQGVGPAVQVCDPLYPMDKAGVIRLGSKLGAPMHLSSTCRAPGLDKHLRKVNWEQNFYNCGSGKCSFCNARRSAFVLAGVKDETKYAYDEPIDPSYLEER